MEKEKMNLYEVCYFDGKEKVLVPVNANSLYTIDGTLFFIDTTNGTAEIICAFGSFLYAKKLEQRERMEAPSDFTKLQLKLVKDLKKTTSSLLES